MSGTVGTVGSCDRRGLDLVAVGTGVGASAIFCADVPIRPDTKIGYFWSCDLGSQWGCKKMEDFLESDPEVGVKIIISPKAKGRR